ncbi:MAG: nitrogenase component 1 [Deltaproteobacteria bacterium]|jgi:nitrogenase molybdenum-iron protein alpha chain|nr:nitrogenase component 1 [Deltaproteobacteria bacterium]
MNYIDSKIPPIRELRHPETSLAHGGKFCEIKSRKGRKCAVFSQADRSFTQGSICPLLPALGIMCTLPNTVVLLHGAVGCGTCANGINVNARAGSGARGRAVQDSVWLSTALDEVNVIHGGDGKLREAIIEVDKQFKPKVILVVSVCLPGVIGDDIDAVADSLKDQIEAKILSVHCEGFKSKFMATAYDVVYHALGRHLLPDPAEVKKKKDKNLLNVMNVGSMGIADEKELSRLFRELGLKVNFFPVFADPESFPLAAQAALSVSVCPTHDDYFLTHLEKKYGVPYVIRHMPIGIENVSRWLLDVAQILGRVEEAKKLVKKEEKELKSALKEFLPAFEGKSAFISAGEYRSLATASLLRELGFKILGIRSFHYDGFAEVELDKLSSDKDFFFNVANVQPFEEANLLKKLAPDVFLGHMHGNSTAARLGIPAQVIYNTAYAYIGYSGVYDLAKRLYRRLTRPQFYHNLTRHGRLPYRLGWYQSDPFVYIRENKEASQ